MKTSPIGLWYRLWPLLLALSLLLAACGNTGGGAPTSGTVNTDRGPVQVALQGGGFTQGPTATQVNAPGFQTPYGGIRFTAQVPQAGDTLTVTLTFPQDLPQGAVLLKCLNGNCNPIQGAQVQGRTATFQVRDGGPLDADGQANGRVVDPVAVGVPTPAPDFTLSLNPTSLTVQQGQSGTTQLTLTPQNGFTGQVSLTLERQDGSPAPQGITLSPTSVNVAGSSPVTQALTLSVGSTVGPGTYALRVRASAGNLDRTANLTVQVPLGPLVWLGPGIAYDVSDDGSTVVGTDTNSSRGFVWKISGSGITTLNVYSRLLGVAGNGQRAVGGFGDSFVWDESLGQRTVEGGLFIYSWIAAISPDGRFAVGKWRTSNAYIAIWDVERALQDPNYGPVLYLPAYFVDGEAYDISDDARTLVGFLLTSYIDAPCPSGVGVKVDLDTQGNPTGYSCLPKPEPRDNYELAVARGIYHTISETVIVGYVTIRDNTGATYAYPIIWRQSLNWAVGTLKTFGAYVYGGAYKVRAGVIVGGLADSQNNARAVRWYVDTAETQVEDLNTTYAHLLQDGSLLKVAMSVSRNGCYIVGQGYNASTGRVEAFRLDTCR